MLMRIAFLLSALFWVMMTYLLWRSEYGGPDHQGGVVPTEVVWRKIITSPDSSPLDILHHGRKAGYAHWTVNEQREAAVAGSLVGGLPVSGLEDVPGGYRLELEGNVMPDGSSGRVYFDLSVELGANRAWQKMTLRITIGKNSLIIRSGVADQNVRLITDEDGEKHERVLTFAELENPQALAESFAVPLPLPLEVFGIPDISGNAPDGGVPAAGLNWEARSSRINIGHSTARAYRLRTRLLDRWPVAIVVSHVGEILQVELPDDWVLTSDQTTGF
jgi:hypothetical protein